MSSTLLLSSFSLVFFWLMTMYIIPKDFMFHDFSFLVAHCHCLELQMAASARLELEFPFFVAIVNGGNFSFGFFLYPLSGDFFLFSVVRCHWCLSVIFISNRKSWKKLFGIKLRFTLQYCYFFALLSFGNEVIMFFCLIEEKTEGNRKTRENQSNVKSLIDFQSD